MYARVAGYELAEKGDWADTDNPGGQPAPGYQVDRDEGQEQYDRILCKYDPDRVLDRDGESLDGNIEGVDPGRMDQVYAIG